MSAPDPGRRADRVFALVVIALVGLWIVFPPARPAAPTVQEASR